jgi:hypothetical protein
MCNLYRLDKGQNALRRFLNATRDDSGNIPTSPRPSSGRPKANGSWKCDGGEYRRHPTFCQQARLTAASTNIRNTSSANWCVWRGVCDANTRA